MILPRGLIPPLALVIALITLTLAFTLGIASAPRDLVVGDASVVVAPFEGRLGEDRVPVALIEPLHALPGIRAVSPEVYVTTTVGDHSVLARGVLFDPFLTLERATIIEGREPAARGEALVGMRAARTLDIKVGDRLTLPGGLVPVTVPVTIVGVVRASSPLKDEILLDLAIAQELAGISPMESHIIRIDAEDPVALGELVSSDYPRFTYSDVRLSSAVALVGADMTVRANLTNWGPTSGLKEVVIRVNDEVVVRNPVIVGARSTVPIEVRFPVDLPGPFNVTINPTFELTAIVPSARFEPLPARAEEGSAIDVRVIGFDDTPMTGGIEVRGKRVPLDENGSARITLEGTGTLQLIAWEGEVPRASATLEVITAGASNLSDVEPVRFRVDAEAFRANVPTPLKLEVRNRGGVRGEAALNVSVDGAVFATLLVDAPPAAITVVNVEVPPLPVGDHVVRIEGTGVAARLEMYGTPDPRVGKALRSMQDSSARSAQVSDDSEGYINELLREVRVGVAALSLASGTLAVLGAASVMARAIATRRGILGMLHALGARREQIAIYAMNEVAKVAAIAGVVGLSSGYALAWVIGRSGAVRAFGHSIEPRLSIVACAAIVVISSASLILITRMLVLRTLDMRSTASLLREAPAR